MTESERATTIQKPSRMPIRLSAFLFPGAGQVMQRRWVPAILFGTGFLACFITFLVCVIKIILAFYSFGLDFFGHEVVETPTFLAAGSFLAALLIYLVGLMDTYGAYRRACSNFAKEKHQN